MVAVYVVGNARLEDGVNVAVLPSGLRDTVPLTALLPVFKVKLVVLTVELCTASLNVAVMGELIATPVAPLAGIVLLTLGGVLSGGPKTYTTCPFVLKLPLT